MRKGFTLIELLGIIIVLGILSIITVPLVADTIQNSKEKAYNLQIDQVKTATKDFMIKNLSISEMENNSFTIYIGELKHAGLLPIEFINSKTNKSISNQSRVTVTKVNNNYSYEIELIDLEENSTQNENSPIITLNGNYIEYVELDANANESYTDLGVTAKTVDGITIDTIDVQIKLNNEVETSISKQAIATYKVIYTATDNGNTSTSVRTVIVRDTTKPNIILPNENTLKVSEVNGFNPLTNVSVTDNSNESITAICETSISNLPGKYTVIYTASDSSGNNTEIRKVFTVIED